MKKLFVLFIVATAYLFATTPAFANSVTYSDSQMNTSNRTWGLNHGAFSISRGSYSSSNKDWIVASVKNNNVVNSTISWTCNDGCSIKVTGVSLSMIGYGTGSQVKARLNSNSYTEIGNLVNSYSTVKITDANGLGNSVSLDVTCSASIARDVRIRSITITYTITPSAPSFNGSTPVSLEVSAGAAGAYTINLTDYFSVNDPDLAMEYAVEGPEGYVINGSSFYSTSKGSYSIKARVKSKTNCHEASAYSSALQVNVWGKETTQLSCLVNGDDSNNAAVAINSIVPFFPHSSNTELDPSTIVVTQLSGSDVATYDPATGLLTTTSKIGTATWQITQPASTNFFAPEPLMVTITTFLPSNYLPMSLTSSNWDNYKVNTKGACRWGNGGVYLGNLGDGFDWTSKYADFSFVGVPRDFSFDYYGEYIGSTDREWYAEVSADGKIWTRLEKWTPKEGSKSYSLLSRPDVRYVRIAFSGNFGGTFKNVLVTRRQEILSEDTYDFGSDYTIADAPTERQIPIKWYDLDPISVTSDNPLFEVVTPTIYSSLDKYDEDASITVRYLHTENNLPTGDVANITLSSGSVTKVITVRGESINTLDLIIEDNEEIAINTPTMLNSLTVEEGGVVTLNAPLTVNDFFIESLCSTADGSSTSGQVINPANLNVIGDAYIDITFLQSGLMSTTEWYAFTVPFPVDLQSDVFRLAPDGTATKAVLGVDFVVASYNSLQRYNTGNGWQYYRNVLNPGEFYYFSVDNVHDTVFRFRKAKGANVLSDNVVALHLYGDNPASPDANWNPVGNPTLSYASASVDDAPVYVQTYINGQSCFKTLSSDDVNFVVGCPFFIQATEESSLVMNAETSVPGPLYVSSASRHAGAVARVDIAKLGERSTDNIYISASEEAEDSYVPGRDLAKMGVGTRVPQIWLDSYGQRLSVHEAVLADNQATFPLSIYAPSADTYVLSLGRDIEDIDVYLTLNGSIFWNLSLSDCALDLAKGTTDAYGICLIHRVSSVTTHVSETTSVGQLSKLMIDGQLYILRDGVMYDVRGRIVK